MRDSLRSLSFGFSPASSLVMLQATGARAPFAAATLVGGFAVMACATASTPPAPAGTAGAPLTATLSATASSGVPTDLPPLPAPGNPFGGAYLYVNPDYGAAVHRAAANAPAGEAALMKKAAAFPTAVWLSAVADVATLPRHLAEAERQASRAGGKPVVSVYSLYNMPGRDCNAKASAGELPASEEGERRYRSEFIDPIALAFAAHPRQRIVVVLETDSLANLATNLSNPTCVAADGPYRRSTVYAISRLSMPNVSVYLDAAHAGWLGWSANRAKIAAIFKDVLKEAGGPDKIRGFFTNVSNYNVLHGNDGKTLEPTNPCPDEMTYVRELADSLRWAGITGKGFLVDTGRNGRGGLRKNWGSWCNVAGAGFGERPRADPAPYVDAYYWIKPPGESDGTSEPRAARFDATCASADAAPGAPEAGRWFPRYFQDLVRYANPPL